MTNSVIVFGLNQEARRLVKKILYKRRMIQEVVWTWVRASTFLMETKKLNSFQGRYTEFLPCTSCSREILSQESQLSKTTYFMTHDNARQ